MSYTKSMSLGTEMRVLAGIFPRLAAVSELLQVQENPVRAQQHGPCCTTRAPVLLFCVGKVMCFLDTLQHGPCCTTRAPVLVPCNEKKNVFSGYVTTRAVLHNTGTRVDAAVLIF